ncbi:MAG TPA: LuxR C-terminal-related transcriptional regulator [Acidimicrobiales bacterium]|nr:LuxR C-terminal-related transcriptional regulator [Acidimicrobiales bacterium]
MKRLVGRDDEFVALSDAITRPGLTAVVGSAGIGKTALLRSALARIPHLEGGALRSLARRPFLPLERALGETLNGADDDIADRVIAATGDAVLFVDDVHWADKRCIAVLDVVQTHCRVLIASRPDGADAAVAHLLESGRTIELAPLEPTDAVRLARRMHPDLSRPQLDRLVEAAGGNPLLLDVLVDEREPSLTLLDALAARVERLDGSTVDALIRLALVGRPIEPSTVGLKCELEGLVRRCGELVELRHALLAEALLKLRCEHHLRRAHADLGAALTGVEAARHFLLADEPLRALAVAREELHTAPEATVRADLALLVAVAADRAGVADSAAWLDAASALVDDGRYESAADAAARAATDTCLRPEALFVQGRARWFSGDVDGAIELLDGALRLVDDGTPLSVRVLVERAYLEVRDRRPGGVWAAKRALAAATGHGIEEVRARAVLGSSLLYEGNPEWETMLTRAIDEARCAGDVELECTAGFHLVSGLGMVGRRRESIDVTVKEIAVAEAAGLRTWHTHFLTALVLNRTLASDDPTWIATAATQVLEEHPLFRNRFQSELSLVFALADLDRFDDAAAAAERHEQTATSSEARLFAGLSLIELAWLRGDDNAVVDLATRLRTLGDAWFGIRIACEFAGACAAVQLGVDFEPALTSFTLPAVWAGLYELDGVRRWRSGDASGALDALDDAARAWLDVECPRWSLRAQGVAAVLARKARRADATTRWTKANEFADRVGLSHHLRRWRAGQPPLSPREVEVLRLVAAGNTSANIAAMLGISPGTVDDHISSSCRKLLVSTRREAAQKVATR